MNILLGIRMAFAGGREGLARMALMAIGTSIGVGLLLLSMIFVPAMHSHVDRLAWHRTNAQTAPSAPDPALWLAVTDRYQGQDILRVHIAPLGPRPPVPPGVERLPGPGEKVVSPALAELLRTVPDDQLGNRYPGRIVGTIGSPGLVVQGELVAIVGQTPEQMRAMHGAVEIRGIEQPGDPLDLAGLMRIMYGLLAVLIVGPVVILIAMVTRIGGARRDQRFAAIRLAGATRFQTAVLAAVETAMAAIGGTLAGWLGFRAVVPIVAGQITLGHGSPVFAEDVRVPLAALLLVLAGVPVLAVATTLVALRPVQMMPLGVRMRVRPHPPSPQRLIPLGIGLAGTLLIGELSRIPVLATNSAFTIIAGILSAVSTLLVLLGFFLAGAWVCMWISRVMARLGRGGATLLVARRIAADPYAAFRAIGSTALALYVATSLGFASTLMPGVTRGSPSALDPHVVVVHVQGASEAEYAPLMAEGVVVARLAPQARISLACNDLAKVTDVSCPLPHKDTDARWHTEAEREIYNRVTDLYWLPHPRPGSSDNIFQPIEFIEPGPEHDRLPAQTLFIPTDGSDASKERIRTLAATTLPFSRSKTRADLNAPPELDLGGLTGILPYAIAFVMFVAACTVTVSAITGVLERRRPFAMLRASGARLGELRRIVILETGVPLAATVLIGVGLAALQALISARPSQWELPGPEFLLGLGAGLVAAFAVSLIALPFMNIATRHDSVRFE